MAVRGGGVELPREAWIRFDGRTYAANPSLAPRARRGAPGRVLIDDDTPIRPLF